MYNNDKRRPKPIVVHLAERSRAYRMSPERTRMFTLELDLSLYYEPLMDEHQPGIIVTREIELPFAPTEGLSVFSLAHSDCPEPPGFTLKDLKDLKSWIGHGWEMGSWMNHYRAEDVEPEPSEDVLFIENDDYLGLDDEEVNSFPVRPPNSRPKRFNRHFGSLIRTLAELYNNLPIAYAMTTRSSSRAPMTYAERSVHDGPKR